MDRNRRHKKNNQNWKTQKNQQPVARNVPPAVEQKKMFQFNSSNYVDEKDDKETKQAILEIKGREVICPCCGQQITDIASALTDKETQKPAHFECILEKVSSAEILGENEKIAYIGQGRFGILYFENPRDQRKFTIKKIIEWEERDKVSPWRTELSELYSKVK